MRFILILLAIFSFSFLNAKDDKSYDKYDYTVTHQNWICEQQGNWGSFWWSVQRTTQPDVNGWYSYYVNFSSNSYFNTDINGDGQIDKAISYISNITVTMYEYNNNQQLYNVVNVPMSYILCDWESIQGAYFYSRSPSNVINIRYDGVSPYNYSNK